MSTVIWEGIISWNTAPEPKCETSEHSTTLYTVQTVLSTVSSCIDLFKFPSQKQERKGGWGPSLASNLTLSFRVLIRPYWPGQVYSLIKDTQIDLDYKNQNVRGRQALKKGQSLIFMYCSQHFCMILRNLVYCFCVMAYPCWNKQLTPIPNRKM